MRSVLIIQAQMKQYRVPLFACLYERLRTDGTRLTVAYSAPPSFESGKGDNVELPAEYGLKVRGRWLFAERMIYQPLFRQALAADLVVVEQANKYILNHVLTPLAGLRLKKVAFWGLGANIQKDRSFISEWWKRRILRVPCRWFAYTGRVAEYLVANGVPPNRITNVENSVDTSALRAQVASVDGQTLSEKRRQLGIEDNAVVGIYCGILDKVKRIPFLIEACWKIHERIPNFHLIIAGGGPERSATENAVAESPWVHYVGPAFGQEKAMLLRMSSVFLLPGRVGLAILDAFAAGLPLCTVRLPNHTPEFDYLVDGENGLVTTDNVDEFADAVIRNLNDSNALYRLRRGAQKAAAYYSIERMAENFRRGIRACLDPSTAATEPQSSLPSRAVSDGTQ